MASDGPLLLESRDLSVCPERGEVRNARGESARLGPINMKVLTLLMSRPGQVIGRAEIFESVWRNQVVGDDVLTRSISDIRAEINRLSQGKNLIETLPRRGYRWTAEVRRATTHPPIDGGSASAPIDEPPAGGQAVTARGGPTGTHKSRLLGWIRRGAAYGLGLVLIASLAVWLMDRLVRPGSPVVALLPIAVAEPAQHETAARIEQLLSDYLIGLDSVDVLAKSAVDSRPSNPFPYFYYEFGAAWLVETELRRMPAETVLTIDLVDARSGIVLLQTSAAFDGAESRETLDVEGVMRPLAAFFESQAGR